MGTQIKNKITPAYIGEQIDKVPLKLSDDHGNFECVLSEIKMYLSPLSTNQLPKKIHYQPIPPFLL